MRNKNKRRFCEEMIQLCNYCKRCEDVDTEYNSDEILFICKYNKGDKKITTGSCDYNHPLFKCKYFKRMSEVVTHTLKGKNYSICKKEILREENLYIPIKRKVKYIKGKFKIKTKREEVREFSNYWFK